MLGIIWWSPVAIPAKILSSQIELLFRVLQLPLSLAYIGLVLNHGHSAIGNCSDICGR
jgi:hypothetical protein